MQKLFYILSSANAQKTTHQLYITNFNHPTPLQPHSKEHLCTVYNRTNSYIARNQNLWVTFMLLIVYMYKHTRAKHTSNKP